LDSSLRGNDREERLRETSLVKRRESSLNIKIFLNKFLFFVKSFFKFHKFLF
jgi:hypothetical protein